MFLEWNVKVHGLHRRMSGSFLREMSRPEGGQRSGRMWRSSLGGCESLFYDIRHRYERYWWKWELETKSLWHTRCVFYANTSECTCMAFIKNVNITLGSKSDFFRTSALPTNASSNHHGCVEQTSSINKNGEQAHGQCLAAVLFDEQTTIFKTSYSKVRLISLASRCCVFSKWGASICKSASNCINDNQESENSSLLCQRMWTRNIL